MKKLLPLAALLVTAALSVPALAEPDAAPAKSQAEMHKHMKHMKHVKHVKKHIRHERHQKHEAMKRGDTVAAQHYQQKIDTNQRIIAEDHREMHSEKVWMPSMQHGFQK